VSNPWERSSAAVRAAASVAAGLGFAADDPCVVADSNHTIVWLRPHEVIAKVGRRSADESLLLEHRVCSPLTQADAPVAAPVGGAAPTRDADSGLLVTLWRRVEHGPEDAADPVDVGESLRAVHNALDRYRGDLPSFLHKLESARAVLADDARKEALSSHDRSFLRAAFDVLTGELRSRSYEGQRLHGEPHGSEPADDGGGRAMDRFRGCLQRATRMGSAFLPEAALVAFPLADQSLLELLRTLNSARTAILCWERYQIPALRWHARFHLQRVRDWRSSLSGGS
jgi:hypothetical protein